MAIIVRVQPESGWIRYIFKMLDPTSCIWLMQFHFFKEGMAHIVQNQIWSRWPGQGLAKCIWSGSNLVCRCRNHQAQFLACCQFPHFQTPLHSSTGILSYCAKPAWIQFGSGRLSNFGQTDPAWKKASVQKSSNPLLANDSEPIWIGSGMFTGIVSSAIPL